MTTCFIQGCSSKNYKNKGDELGAMPNIRFFTAPKDSLCAWQKIVPPKNGKPFEGKGHQKVCERHFREFEILKEWEIKINGETARVPRTTCRLQKGAIPSLHLSLADNQTDIICDNDAVVIKRETHDYGEDENLNLPDGLNRTDSSPPKNFEDEKLSLMSKDIERNLNYSCLAADQMLENLQNSLKQNEDTPLANEETLKNALESDNISVKKDQEIISILDQNFITQNNPEFVSDNNYAFLLLRETVVRNLKSVPDLFDEKNNFLTLGDVLPKDSTKNPWISSAHVAENMISFSAYQLRGSSASWKCVVIHNDMTVRAYIDGEEFSTKNIIQEIRSFENICKLIDIIQNDLIKCQNIDEKTKSDKCPIYFVKKNVCKKGKQSVRCIECNTERIKKKKNERYKLNKRNKIRLTI